MMKVHMVHIIQLAIVLDMIDERKKNNLGGKNQKINHDTNYYNKPVMFQMGLVLERSKFKT